MNARNNPPEKLSHRRAQ